MSFNVIICYRYTIMSEDEHFYSDWKFVGEKLKAYQQHVASFLSDLNISEFQRCCIYKCIYGNERNTTNLYDFKKFINNEEGYSILDAACYVALWERSNQFSPNIPNLPI